MASRSRTLAVLECDQPLDAARIARGGHTGVWTYVFTTALTDLSLPVDSLTIVRYNAEEKLPSFDDDNFDAVLISGSRYNAWADDEWIVRLVEFTKACVEKKIPVIGICFGHQIAGRALGCVVNRNEAGWEVAPTVLDLSEKGKEIFGQDTLTLHLMNRDIVRSCPSGMTILASTSKTENHGFYQPDAVFTVQGHPEFEHEITAELLKMRNESKVIPDDTYAEAQQRLDRPHDGILVGRALLKFLGVAA
ncbi:hypothetical protein Dda_5570 [Drechslerella dactyloides]|uniref:Glutamine amidotransferase domain-containing protein n=1 Tax=Drechslerella dactyloides TaxID=74499 RepID=A0AAD6IWS1_DREDA|nr:hypothetical protein Dda_5570 [Drechslerella dactyloides]